MMVIFDLAETCLKQYFAFVNNSGQYQGRVRIALLFILLLLLLLLLLLFYYYYYYYYYQV